MKIGVLSDSHHDKFRMLEVIDAFKEEGVTCILHAGDNYSDAQFIESVVDVPVYMVKGNCDFETSAERIKIIELKGTKILLTHGHLFNVRYNSNGLVEKAQEENCDCVVYGHTHIPQNELIENVLVFNPGSITQPRGRSTNSYGILELFEGRISGQIKKL